MNETAFEFHVTPLTIRRWLNAGNLEFVRMGRTIRIPREAVFRRKPANEVAV